MKSIFASASAAIVLALLSRTVASADSFTTVDISSYLNGNVSTNAETFPVGITTGNQGIIIPFNVSSYYGKAGTWLAWNSYPETVDVSLSVQGQASFYALLNNYYGTPGADEYDITIKATNGDSITYSSIGGADTRDYNASTWSNTISNTTTPWFDNGIGQRLDAREFTLPSRFSNETISDFIITQVDFRDPALFSGLTFSSSPASFTATPEPVSLTLSLTGLLLLGAYKMRRSASRDDR